MLAKKLYILLPAFVAISMFTLSAPASAQSEVLTYKTCSANPLADNFASLKSPWLEYYRSEKSFVTADGQLKLTSNEASGVYINSGFADASSFYSGDFDISIKMTDFKVGNNGALDWLFQASAWGNIVLQTNDTDWVQIKIKRDTDGYELVMQYNLKENAKIIGALPVTAEMPDNGYMFRLIRKDSTLYGLVDSGSGYQLLGTINNVFTSPVSIGLGVFQTTGVDHDKYVVFDDLVMTCPDSAFLATLTTTAEVEKEGYSIVLDSGNLPVAALIFSGVLLVNDLILMLLINRKQG